MPKPTWISLTGGIALIGGLFILVGLSRAPKTQSPSVGSLVVTLSVDKSTCRPGETIQATLQVANPTAQAVTLSFSSSQRFDLVIEDEGGGELWRWSQGRFFLQVLGQVTLTPGGPPLIFHAEAPAPAEPGSYRLLGGLANEGRVFSAYTSFTVR